MTTLSYTVPVAGSTPNSVADPELVTALNAIVTWANGNVDGVNVPASLTGRRLIGQASVFIGGSFGAGSTLYQIANDGSVVSVGTATAKPLMFWALDPATYQVTGKANTQIVMRTSYVSGTAPGTTVSVQMNAISSASASGSNFTIATGASPGSGGGAVISTNGQIGSFEGAPFTFPTVGNYAPFVTLAGTTAASSSVSLLIQLYALNS